jgi:uncharacterized membrane protein YdbT with pleckstrin-like domain
MPLFSAESRAALEPGEEIVARARLHWMVYRWPFILFCYGFAMLLVGMATFANVALAFPAAFVMIASLCGGAIVSLMRRTTEAALTDRRVILREGLVGGVDRAVDLMDIESVELKRDAIGRALDCGNLEIVTRGGEKRSIRPLAEASKFQRWVLDAKAAREADGETPPEPDWAASGEALQAAVGGAAVVETQGDRVAESGA